ncbi:CheR family methyltransferase [Neopusillimonas aromaticivorans]|uniref:CheR family methyltransferase n=1 Tax=Neopusillimonas aromaticivorans TaxID=2979868 RepID=UPI0025953D27|nr:CheR family methyltransferase [Neopusillimonas aromaticivorans]WJJ93172.1 CheR family methyltransferase [Neopusillimonas aromaticivorans]
MLRGCCTSVPVLSLASTKEMATRTLSMRARKLGVQTVAEYLGYLSQNPDGLEWEEFVNSFTINHTAFFREQHHFETLKTFVKTRKAPINIWCSAASTGEEPYSIAMTLLETLPNAASQCFIWATDIDTQAIARAERGFTPLIGSRRYPSLCCASIFCVAKMKKRLGACQARLAEHDQIRTAQPAVTTLAD